MNKYYIDKYLQLLVIEDQMLSSTNRNVVVMSTNPIEPKPSLRKFYNKLSSITGN